MIVKVVLYAVVSCLCPFVKFSPSLLTLLYSERISEWRMAGVHLGVCVYPFEMVVYFTFFVAGLSLLCSVSVFRTRQSVVILVSRLYFSLSCFFFLRDVV